jgi:hypothetical protein
MTFGPVTWSTPAFSIPDTPTISPGRVMELIRRPRPRKDSWLATIRVRSFANSRDFGDEPAARKALPDPLEQLLLVSRI